MMDESYEYCKIFAKGTDPDSLRGFLARLFGGHFDIRTMTVCGLVIDVLGNSYATGDDDPEDFVTWPVILEIETQDAESPASVVRTISEILTALWDAQISAVAACDFEDELPWSGGIQRLRQAEEQ